MIISWQISLAILDDGIHHFLIALFSGKEKVSIFTASHVNAFPLIDPVCIHDDSTSLGLTKNPCQTHYRKAAGINNISEHIACSNTWKLVDISHQNQRHLRPHCF